MISVGDLLYNQQERPPKSAQCTIHYLIRVMMHAPYRVYPSYLDIPPLSLSLSLSFFFFDRLFVTTHHPIMSFQPNFSHRHFLLKYLFFKFLMHDLLHELDTRVYSAVRIRYCVWDYERFVWRAIWPELIHIHIMMSQDLHIWLEQWDHCSQFFFSFWDGCSYTIGLKPTQDWHNHRTLSTFACSVCKNLYLKRYNLFSLYFLVVRSGNCEHLKCWSLSKVLYSKRIPYF